MKSFQRDYIADHREGLSLNTVLSATNLLGPRNIGGGVLPEFFLVPAVRDLPEEMKVRSTAYFGRLLQRAVQEMAERDPRFGKLRQELQDLVSVLNADPERPDERPAQLAELEKTLKEELGHWAVDVSIQVLPPDIERIFELGTQLEIDDGVSTGAEFKGHGLQRAVIFALIRAWSKVLRSTAQAEAETVPRKSSASMVFAVEEPELFLHPHGQRRLAQSLRELAEAQDHQVFVCTHSTHFIDLDHYQDLVIVSKPSPRECTRARQCTRDLFEESGARREKDQFHLASWVNPDRAELFFAKRVVLVEGATEQALLPFVARRIECFDSDVSVIECGSKHNIMLYIKLLNAFEIPYVVIHDEDPLPEPIPEDWNKGKRESKKRTYQVNEAIRELVDAELGKVFVFKPKIEDALGISKTLGDRKGKALAAIETFDGVPRDELPTPLVDAVLAAFPPTRS